MNIKEIIIAQKLKLQEELAKDEQAWGEIIFNNGNCQILTQSPAQFELIVSDDTNGEIIEYHLNIDEDEQIAPFSENSLHDWDRMAYACLL